MKPRIAMCFGKKPQETIQVSSSFNTVSNAFHRCKQGKETKNQLFPCILTSNGQGPIQISILVEARFLPAKTAPLATPKTRI